MRIADGLHVFGHSPEPALRDATVDALAQTLQDSSAPQEDGSLLLPERMRALIDRCGEAEKASLLAALDGRFVQAGPGGAPSRGRIDVLPRDAISMALIRVRCRRAPLGKLAGAPQRKS